MQSQASINMQPGVYHRVIVRTSNHITSKPALQEINFVLSDLALEIVGDAAIVWLLSPKAAIAARPAGGLARLTGSLPGYCLQVMEV